MAKAPTKAPAKKPRATAKTADKASPKASSEKRGTPKGKGTRPGGKGGRIGNPPFVATLEQRLVVEYLTASGCTQAMIAEKLGVSVDTLDRHFREELDEGTNRATARLGGELYEGALKGDARKMEMWFDRRGGPDWQKKTGVELSGPGGSALVVTINGTDAKL